MSDQPRFEACMAEAKECLDQAAQFHRRGRDPGARVASIPDYQSAIEKFRMAARLFADCTVDATDPVSRDRARAWQHYCLAMVSGDEAAVLYHYPEPKRHLVLSPTRKASEYMQFALEKMPWGSASGEDDKERRRWEGLEFSFQGLEHRALAETLEKRERFKEAVKEYEIASRFHEQAADAADMVGDKQSYLRAMGRAKSAKRDAYLSLGFAHKGVTREEYFKKAYEEAKLAAEYRPEWDAFREIADEIREKYAKIALQRDVSHNRALAIIGSIISLFAGAILGVIFQSLLGH